MRVQLLRPADRLWSETLQQVDHDFYHLPEYVKLAAEGEDGEPVALRVDDGQGSVLLQPVLRRPLPADFAGIVDGFDVTSPYGYPGPAVRGNQAFTRAALAAAVSYLESRGCISLFVRMHPLLNESFVSLSSLPGVMLPHGETVVVDLHETEDEHWAQTRSGHRNEINKAIRRGHTASMDERFDRLLEFTLVYRATMSRLGAAQYYLFDDTYFTGLREALGRHLHLCTVEIDGDFGAGALFTEVSGIVQYHLSATDERYLRERPTKLLLHHVRRWAKARGNRWLHLGGGVGSSEDSLFRFKSGFSHGRRRFHTWRVVCRPAAYARLVDARHGASGRLDGRGYFPDYRRPAES